ncbi:MAG: ABC transporter permease [Alkalinema sp. RU_4_3]|nr:ABC transporter permease [Alkalinema sp. RU_4_3]
MSTILSIDELLQRVGAQPEDGNVWFVLTLPFAHHGALAEDLGDVLEIFTESSVGKLSGHDGVLPLVASIASTDAASLILSGFEQWTMQDWRQLDALRSNLTVQRNAFLLLSEMATSIVLNYAPNLASWIGVRVYPFTYGTEFLTVEEQEDRLVGLRSWAGKTDDEIIALAESHQLSPEPEYGEWLVLLGRGDLIER